MKEIHFSFTGMAVFIVLLLVVMLIILAWIYPTSQKQTTIPGPDPADHQFGNLNEIERTGSLPKYLTELHEKYGDLASFSYGRCLVISNSNYKDFAARNEVFTTPDFFLKFWKHCVGKESFIFADELTVGRRRGNLEFKVSATVKQTYAKMFRDLSSELVKKWKGLPEGQHIPMLTHIRALATKAVCRITFGEYFSDQNNVIKLHKTWQLCWNEVVSSMKDDPTKDPSELVKDNAQLRSIVEDAIEHRWSCSDKDGNELLPVLIDQLLVSSNINVGTEQLVSDALTLFTVGVQTTTAVLSWACYFMLRNPKAQEKFRKKVSEAASLDIMPESLLDMKYMQCVLKETVRCGSVFPLALKRQNLDVTYITHNVLKDTALIEAVGVAMKNERLWPEPRRFDPERFAAKEDVPFNPLIFIPFAFAASRKNPQDSLVYSLASIVLASIFRQLRITATTAGCDEEPCRDDDTILVTFPSRDEIWCTATAPPRDGAAESSPRNGEKTVENVGRCAN